jgi:hypothetical protein
VRPQTRTGALEDSPTPIAPHSLRPSRTMSTGPEFSAMYSPSPAPVAQGIERRFPKPCVAGSNPAGGANVVAGQRVTSPRWPERHHVRSAAARAAASTRSATPSSSLPNRWARWASPCKGETRPTIGRTQARLGAVTHRVIGFNHQHAAGEALGFGFPARVEVLALDATRVLGTLPNTSSDPPSLGSRRLAWPSRSRRRAIEGSAAEFLKQPCCVPPVVPGPLPIPLGRAARHAEVSRRGCRPVLEQVDGDSESPRPGHDRGPPV